MNTPLWFSNLLFWSAQVAVLALAAAFLPRLLQLRQPRVLLAYWRTLLAIALLLPVIQPWHRIATFSAFVIAPDVTNLPVSTTSSPVASSCDAPSSFTTAGTTSNWPRSTSSFAVPHDMVHPMCP